MKARPDPRFDLEAVSDKTLLAEHSTAFVRAMATGAPERRMPLIILFIFSGLIFFSAVYLGRYAGRFDSSIFNENLQPSPAGVLVAKADPIVLGRKSYQLVCFTCHQSTGKGLNDLYPPLAGSEWVNGTPERVIRILLHGLSGRVTVKGNDYSANVMPSFGKLSGSGYKWSDEKIAAVLSYIRQEWGNHADPISTEQVTAVRVREGERRPWTQDELREIP